MVDPAYAAYIEYGCVAVGCRGSGERSLAAVLAFIERGAPERLGRLRQPRRRSNVRPLMQRDGECS